MKDLISRQAAIEAMCGACSDWCDEGVCKKVSAIQKLPSEQPPARCVAKIKIDKGDLESLIARQIEELKESMTNSAKPEQQWIPCSERLPEVNEEPFYIDPITGEKLYESKRVLVCGKGKDGYDYSVASHVYSTATGHGWAGAYDAADMEMRGIIAWQPIPEPYEGGNNV